MKEQKIKLGSSAGYFSIRQAASLSRLTPTMVDYLCRTGILIPSGNRRQRGRGKTRKYLFGDVVMLRVIGKLLECGISVLKLKKALRQLRKSHSEITETSLPGHFLITDGSTVYFKSREDIVEDLLASGQLTFGFVIELRNIRDSVSKDVSVLINVETKIA